MSTYNANANVYTLAQALAQDPDAKGKVYTRQLEVQSNTKDDFSLMIGSVESEKPVWLRKDLSADGGDIVKLNTIGDAAGPGVRGEEELTGNTSIPKIGGYTVQVDFWRDAVEVTKKQLKFLAAGKSIESVLTKMLAKKLGRQRQNDGMMCLIRKANGNIYRVGNRANRNAIEKDDVFVPAALTEARARLMGLGGRPVGLAKSKSGSPVLRYLAFAQQDALASFRNTNTWQNAILNAAERADDNPAFSGRLFDWMGTNIWEHVVVDPSADDYIGSPIAPKARLGEAISAGTTTFDIKGSATNTKSRYFQFFPGYDYKFVETQSAAPDSTTYYAWIINTSGADAGKAMFVSYVGTGNNGNKITITKRLGASATGDQVTTLGAITWDAAAHTNAATAGAWVLPANSLGTPIGYSFVLGAGALLRAVGSIDTQRIEQKRDYDFVHGMGYEGIWGHNVSLDPDGKPRNYILIEHAVDYPGIIIPGAYGEPTP